MNKQVIKIEGIRSNDGATKKDGSSYKENTSNLMLSTPFSRGGSGVLSTFFGGRVGKIVAFQSVDNEVLKGWGVSEGDDLNAIKDVNLALQVTEVTESEFQALGAEGQRGFTAKINPETKAQITNGGEQVYMKSEVVMASDLKHTVLATDKVEETVKA